MEVDDRGVHSLYKQLVNSGHAFGAKRWVATLDRQCERLASAMATNIPHTDVGGNDMFRFYFDPPIVITRTFLLHCCKMQKFRVAIS